MWTNLGFRDSPYNAKPLRAVEADAPLLIGREADALSFCTALDSADDGVLIISGAPGVGKTSFLNIQQYLLATDKSPFGPKALPAYQLCPIYPGDDARKVSLRILHAVVTSVETYAKAFKATVPTQTKKISKWVNSQGSGGFDLGIQILGFGGNFGRDTTLPSVGDATFENIRDAVACVVSECIQDLNVDCAIVVLDNVENLDDEQLGRVLFTFRDTLFDVPNVWWVLIGQKGLSSLIQTLDPRIADRICGNPLELEPISFDQFESAIGRRVQKFTLGETKKSPLPTVVHRRLYDQSRGEIRFVFKYATAICTKYMQQVRSYALSRQDEGESDDFIELVANRAAGQLIRNQLAETIAFGSLNEIITQEFDGLNLRSKDLDVLQRIHERGQARAKDYKEFSIKSMQDFSSNYLTALHRQHLLARRQEGRAVYYSLRGVAALAAESGLFAPPES